MSEPDKDIERFITLLRAAWADIECGGYNVVDAVSDVTNNASRPKFGAPLGTEAVARGPAEEGEGRRLPRDQPVVRVPDFPVAWPVTGHRVGSFRIDLG